MSGLLSGFEAAPDHFLCSVRHLEGLGNRWAVLLVIAQKAASLPWACPCRGSSFPCSCLVSRGGRCQPALVSGGRRGKAAVTFPGTGWIMKGGSGSLVFWAWDTVRTVPTGGELERRLHSCRVDVFDQLLLLPFSAAMVGKPGPGGWPGKDRPPAARPPSWLCLLAPIQQLVFSFGFGFPVSRKRGRAKKWDGYRHSRTP